MPAGTRFLVGTTAALHVVKDGVEYHCTIHGLVQGRESPT